MVDPIECITNDLGPKCANSSERGLTPRTVSLFWNPTAGGRFMVSLFETLGICLSAKSPEVNNVFDGGSLPAQQVSQKKNESEQSI